MTKDDLITEIEAFSEKSGLAPSTITGRFAGNSRLYARLKAGNGCTIDVAYRLIERLRAQAPSNERGAGQ